MGNFLSDTWKDITDPGWKERKKSNEYQQQAISSQSAWEQKQQQRLQGQQDDRLGFLNAWLYGKPYQRTISNTSPYGVTATSTEIPADFTGQGAMPQAQTWLTNYLNYLQNAPDTTYNAQRTSMERGISDATNNAARAMRRRGLGNTGMAANAIGNVQMQRARMLGGLEGERETRRGEMLSKGTQLTQSLLDRILNLQTAAYGMPTVQGTQVPQMLAQQGQNYMIQSQNGSPLADAASLLVSQGVQNYFGNRNKIGPNDVAVDSGYGGGTNPFYSSLTSGNSRAKDMILQYRPQQSSGGIFQKYLPYVL